MSDLVRNPEDRFSRIAAHIIMGYKGGIIGQIGHCIGGNFNTHIWAWSASPSVQVGKF